MSVTTLFYPTSFLARYAGRSGTNSAGSVSAKQVRYYLDGVHRDPAGVAVLTDGHRLAPHRLAGLPLPERRIIVPRLTVEVLLKAPRNVKAAPFDRHDRPRSLARMRALDALNRRFGRNTVSFAGAGRHRRKLRSRFLSPRFTTSCDELLRV
jgi:hypothetical protein